MIKGGCYCGELQYAIDGEALDAGYCHCNICRRTTGAPYLIWVTFKFEDFSYTKGQPCIFKSSATGQREFCNVCGTQVCYVRSNAPKQIDINVGSLNDPGEFPPGCHIFVNDKISWVNPDGELPVYEHEKDRV